MKFSTKSQYGLRAMIFLAKNKGKFFSSREIARAEKIPFEYLEKILSKLEKAGLVVAKKGSKGGYFLAKDPKKITIGQITKALQERLDLVKCLSEKSYCPLLKKCLAKKFWQRLKKSINLALNSITLASLIKK